MTLAEATVGTHCDETWEAIVPVLSDYIAIPNVSLDFDPQWREHGHMQRAVDLIADWCRARPIPGLRLDVIELPERTPMIVMEVPPAGGGAADDTVLLYGHLDKQPEMEGWRSDLGPWTPVIEGDRLYGRGGADDGYAAFASLTAIEAVHAAGGAHTRCVVLIEASEESGSPDLPAYIDHLADRIGTPSLVICLDSGCIDYDRLWVTTSLRGMVMGRLSVDIVTEGLHSGDVSGMVPSTFRIARRLLDRIEDAETGRILLPEFEVEIPEGRVAEATATGAGDRSHRRSLPVRRRRRPHQRRPRRTAVVAHVAVGAQRGGCRRHAAHRPCRERAPPEHDAEAVVPDPADRRPAACAAAVTEALESDPPYGARVRFGDVDAAPSLDAPRPLRGSGPHSTQRPPQRSARQRAASAKVVPSRFMGMLGERFPDAQFVITGVLGPTRTPTAPTSTCTCPPPAASARRWHTCSTRMPTDDGATR